MLRWLQLRCRAGLRRHGRCAAPATSQHDVDRLVAADDDCAAIDRSGSDRKHRFDFLSKTIPSRICDGDAFEELMLGTGVGKVRGLFLTSREAFITPRKI
jgi:hypothetical protein